MTPTVGVLALQGDFTEHIAALQRAGVRAREVRLERDLEGLDGFVLPGGESTTMLRLLDAEGFEEPIGRVLRSGIPVLATCAGLILVARSVTNPDQRSYGVLDVAVARNGYGRQYHSGTFDLDGEQLPAGTRGVFIRAPRVIECGPEVEVLARRGEDPVLMSSGSILAACFHPELEVDHPVTAMFVARVHEGRQAVAR